MGQTAEKLAQVFKQTHDSFYNNPRLADNRRRLKFVEAFGRELGPMLTSTVNEGYLVGVTQLEHLVFDFQLTREEHEKLKRQVSEFAPKFSNWFSKRFSNALSATVGIDSRYSEQVMNNDLSRLLCANEAQLHLQNALHAAFDTAIRNYKNMIQDTALTGDARYHEWGVNQLLERTNPANVSLMLMPLLERLSLTDDALWVTDRVIHTQIFLKLSDFYREITLALEKMSREHPM